MNQDEMIRRLVATGRVTRDHCTAFLAAAAECGLEVVPRRDGAASVGAATPSPRPSFSHGRTVVARVPARRVEIAPVAGRAARLLPAEPDQGS